MAALLVIGNPLLDISAEVPAELLEKYDLKQSDAILAEEKHAPLYAEMEENYEVEYIAGGAGLNSTRAAQWMFDGKASTVYIGCIGKDAYGTKMKEGATNDGVSVHFLEDENTKTGTCACLITDKERSLVADLAAANNYKKEHLDENFELVESAQFFYATGFFLTVSVESLLAIAQHAASTNKAFAMNLAAPFLIDFFWDGKMEALFPFVDVLFGNEHEAAALGKRMNWGEKLEVIAEKAAKMPKNNYDRERLVVFTQGCEDVIVYGPNGLEKFPTAKVPEEELVDFNGAGDCFVGGFLSHYALTEDIKGAVEAGHFCAGVCIRTSGIKFEKPRSSYA